MDERQEPGGEQGQSVLKRRAFLVAAGSGALVVGMGVASVAALVNRRTQPPAPLIFPTPRPTAPVPAAGPVGGGELGGAVGITTIAGPVQKRLSELPPAPLYWQVETFPTLQAARAVEKPWAMSVQAEGKGWLFTLGPQGMTSPGGTLVLELGPVPAPTSSEYLLQLSLQTRAPRIVGSEHSHPGVESWYIVEGEQTLLVPTLGQEFVVRAGEGLVGPQGGTPIRILNTGPGQRTAFNMFVLDSSKPAANEGADVATVDEAFKRAFKALDVDATLDLFADESVELSPLGVFPGKPAIRASIDTFIRANPGFAVSFEESEIVRNTAVHRVLVSSDPIRATGIIRFALWHTLVVTRGKIVTLSQVLDLADLETARYALGLAPEGR
jgi:mannose-6-phosphate isomerase-like protein (cupin superfamily)